MTFKTIFFLVKKSPYDWIDPFSTISWTDRTISRLVSLSIDPSTKKHIIPDLMGEQSWDSMMNYSKSKMAGLMLAFEFGRRLAGTGAVSVALHPGVVRTGLSRHTNPFMRYIFHFVLGFFGKSPWQGCQTVRHFLIKTWLLATNASKLIFLTIFLQSSLLDPLLLYSKDEQYGILWRLCRATS